MFKIFALAAAVSFLPHFKKNSFPKLKIDTEKQVALFPFKNTITTNPFETEKKTAEAWNQNWMAIAQENIRKSEYHFNWHEKLNAWCTPNRKNNLRFFYNEKGFTVQPRSTQIAIGDDDPMIMPADIKYRSIPDWKIQFILDKKQVGKGKWQIVNNKAEYITDNITVQYINNDAGMRQNFIVNEPLTKSNTLKINFNVNTNLRAVLINNRIAFYHKKTEVLHYKDLKVWDATGKLLTAAFKKNKANKYYIQVDTKEAVYPITIDPISTTPSAIVESNQADARMGFSVASAGDVNGDGYSDVVVGVLAFDNPEIDEGAAFIYHGSATGINTTVTTIVESNQANARMGLSVSSAGDVNGDGYSDIIVGAHLYDKGENDEGVAFVYHGSATGINPVMAAILESDQVNGQLGYSVACAGDVNGDGYSDVIAGAWQYDDVESNEGVAFIYHGSATGINTIAATLVQEDQAGSNFGISVAGAGDVNGDGYSDIIVGAEDFTSGETNEGVVFIYHGSAAGIINFAIVSMQEDLAFSQYGFSVSSAGDVNGDGYSDVIVGAYSFSNGHALEGVAFIYHGSATSINSTAAALVESNQLFASFGVSVACAGDINGDGYSDVIVGAFAYDNIEAGEGAAFVYLGSAIGLNTTAIAILESNQVNAQMGRAVSGAGDVNGDGYSDVIAGAQLFDNGENDEGAAFVYHGSAAGLSNTPNSALDDADQALANFGYSVASAGDVNGDGYSDVIIGAPYYDDTFSDEGKAFVYHGSATGLSPSPDNTPDDANQANAQFGFSVASAGDVNGDGYSDVIIGAPSYDGLFSDEGGAFVYHGSASGLSSSPDIIFEDANQISARFGVSAASAGDINGDGYSDVIIGAMWYDDTPFTNEGAAFVYFGSSTGLSAIPDHFLDDADQDEAWFGTSVSSSGDVNGDGFSDVIIGAYLYDDPPFTDEGRAFIYYGSATGLSASPDDFLNDADQNNAGFGASVAYAGDVNGDGFADVIIGAYLYDDTFTDEGKAFVYHGSASGLSATPDNTPDDADQATAYFGISVGSAGDINGDGYADVIIGAMFYDNPPYTNEGKAFVYLGSSTGLSLSPGFTTDDANQSNARFGTSVSSAGDVNGDGYSDVLIGADGFTDAPFGFEGRAFLYHGNDSASNKRNNLRLYNNDLTTPINSSNFVFGNFGAGLFAKSFLGRVKGKLVWETRLNYNAYSGIPITNSTFFTAQQSAYSNLGLAGFELKNIIDKLMASGRYTKLRARVKYDPVTALTGQVYSPWRNVSSIIDGNGLGALPVELISFKAAWLQKGKTALINFTTDKESGICCFEIEKSTDGFHFTSIGTVVAKNTAGIQEYRFVDDQARNKKQFYRLQIKGLNGKAEHSNIQQLQNSSATEILVFPNPTSDVLQLQLNGTFEKMNVQIINSSGQLVKRLQLSVSNQAITIPVQNLAAGQYWLQLQSGNEKQVLQFVKQ